VIVDEPSSDFLNVRQTAERLGVHENTVRNWARKGVLRSARVPGTAFLRFDPRDVERLLENRGESVASVEEERRVVGPELVDARQLDQWAGTRDAQHRFPELMRRLLAATPGVTNIAVRAGEGIAAPGWDGRADSEESSFLPRGSLCFEFGVGKNPRQKATEDYEKRSEKPEGVSPKDSIFVFATPRRWSTAEEWASERRAEQVFGDVRVVDADDLEGWLQQTPAVHHWISEQLGRRPQDAKTLEQWWDLFQNRTIPSLPLDLFLAGREQESKQLTEFLFGEAQVIAVQAAWRDDALAFIWATIKKLTDEGKSPQPALAVSSADVWNRVVAQTGRMTLLPLFDGADLAAARKKGHLVLLPLGWEQAVHGEHLQLPRLDRYEATKALEAAGREDAYELSALARRSLPALVRHLASNPSFSRPEWANPSDGSVLAPLVLVGAWTAGGGDTHVVSEVSERPWAEVERLLLRWRSVDDPPFVHPSNQWHLASAREAFALLQGFLSASDLERWEKIAVEVLLEKDPRLDLAVEERPMASLQGAVRTHSSVLREGLAQGIALLATAGDAPMGDGVSGRDHAHGLTVKILARANQDLSGRQWASLVDELSLLAEAAPDAFLDAVHFDLDRDEPVLRLMFQDAETGSALFTSSPHTPLLWALETMCWSTDHLLEASRALARLAALDPGGRLSNRPKNSLRSIFVGWVRHTSAPVPMKMRALEQMTRETPDVAWHLLLALWPRHHATSSSPSSPRFQDWKPEHRSVTVTEWSDFVEGVVRLALGMAATDVKRWGELSQRLGSLPPELREQVIAGVEHFVEEEDLSGDDRLELWEHVDREVARHRRFPSADWALEDEPLRRLEELARRLEPKADVNRHAYLFDWRPHIPDAELGEPKYREALATLRSAALQETLALKGLEGVRSLAGRARARGQLGWALGEIAPEDFTVELLSWLDSEDSDLREVAAGWASRKLRNGDVAWLRAALDLPGMTELDRRKALVKEAPATSAVWDTLKEVDEELFHLYWREAGIWAVDGSDANRAVNELLSHRRPWQAIDLLTSFVHFQEEGDQLPVEVELIAKVLDAALAVDLEESDSQQPGYEVGVLLDYLGAQDYPLAELTRYEFLFFSLLEDFRQPKALFAALGEEADLFVDLVKRVYRGKNEKSRSLSERDAALAQHSWRILEAWRRVPGVRDDQTIDADHLAKWVQEARLAFLESDREDIGDEQIGAVLSASPEGTDGIWPAEPVRELLEQIGSTSIETGLHVGVVNSRGITSRSPYAGGDQERALASRYRSWSQECAGRWPRTSRVLRSLAETYDREARGHDARAEVSGDVE
jgi:excisionase family DNA binding protein